MDFNTILTSLYYVSGIILVIVAIYGLNQIRLFKRDLAFRIERTAKEKAIEASRIYVAEFIALSNKNFMHRRIKKDPSLHFYKGPIGNFTENSIPKELIDNANKRISIISWLPAINCLESIAAYFTTGVADEKIGYKIIGRSFCANVEYDYDIISLHRISKPLSYWSNIVELYNIWAPRLSKNEISDAKKNLENQLSKIKDEQIKIIGQD